MPAKMLTGVKSEIKKSKMLLLPKINGVVDNKKLRVKEFF